MISHLLRVVGLCALCVSLLSCGAQRPVGPPLPLELRTTSEGSATRGGSPPRRVTWTGAPALVEASPIDGSSSFTEEVDYGMTCAGSECSSPWSIAGARENWVTSEVTHPKEVPGITWMLAASEKGEMVLGDSGYVEWRQFGGLAPIVLKRLGWLGEYRSVAADGTSALRLMKNGVGLYASNTGLEHELLGASPLLLEKSYAYLRKVELDSGKMLVTLSTLGVGKRKMWVVDLASLQGRLVAEGNFTACGEGLHEGVVSLVLAASEKQPQPLLVEIELPAGEDFGDSRAFKKSTTVLNADDGWCVGRQGAALALTGRRGDQAVVFARRSKHEELRHVYSTPLTGVLTVAVHENGIVIGDPMRATSHEGQRRPQAGMVYFLDWSGRRLASPTYGGVAEYSHLGATLLVSSKGLYMGSPGSDWNGGTVKPSVFWGTLPK